MAGAGEETPRLQRRRPLSEERKAELEARGGVGFGRPPEATRFRKGQSGNPAGRPKAARALKTDVAEVLDLEVTVNMPAGPTPMRMQQAMVMSIAAKAAKGDVRAAQAMIALISLTLPERVKDPPHAVRLDPVEQAMLEDILKQMGLGEPAPGEPPPDQRPTSSTEAAHPIDDWDIV
jgi:hypothetical protein